MIEPNMKGNMTGQRGRNMKDLISKDHNMKGLNMDKEEDKKSVQLNYVIL